MPKDTFHNLPEEKREEFINAFLEEFSRAGFELASITAVVKQLGIAKGSVYQYFENKLDLFLYLKGLCESTKMRYVMHVNVRENYPDFWEFYRALYHQGVKFDIENVLQSKFLYRIGKSENSEVLRPYMEQWKQQALIVFSEMIRKEVVAGYFRNDVSIEVMAHFLVSVSLSIEDLMRNQFGINFDQNIEEGRPLFALDEGALFQALDQLILLLKNAFDKSLQL